MKALRRWWRWFARGMLVYRWTNTTGVNQAIHTGQLTHPIVLAPWDTLEITIYPGTEGSRRT